MSMTPNQDSSPVKRAKSLKYVRFFKKLGEKDEPDVITELTEFFLEEQIGNKDRERAREKAKRFKWMKFEHPHPDGYVTMGFRGSSHRSYQCSAPS